ncbi:hypothetical protein [Bacillus infantis]|uniref:hypothetical protein n=1 Tax=Bacillus infantis TaxID=324767 RepID=UPI00209F5F62|nr:hypothetical protein [Bacillus infantis]MCP1159320.1 hypothetical protein [Bacillus infantis]
MRNRTTMDMVTFKLKEINKYLSSSEQRITMSEKQLNESNEAYWNLTWYSPIDKETELSEFMFGGDDWELFSILSGIEYGIRMEKRRREQSGI